MAPRMVVPTGKTFFEELKFTYNDINLGPDNKIPSIQFPDATENFVKLFHIAEGLAFTVVEKDMVGNITKIRERFLAVPLKSETLQDLVENELAEKQKKATDALFWLTRALEFTSASIKHAFENGGKELKNCFQDMYVNTLKPYHSWIMSTGFSAGLNGVPYRKDFFTKMGDDQTKVNEQALEWLGGVDKILAILNPYMNSKKKDIGIKG